MAAINKLTRGLNLWGWSASVDMVPGESLDCQDVTFRSDGAFHKDWGWRRINPSALGARIVAHKGFVYKGKNSPAASTARTGNFGIANDGADYTRRVARYTSAIVLTETECRVWNPNTEVFDAVALPGGVTVDIDPKPSLVVFQNNVYIFGWATQNLRYDPTDRALYRFGWDGTAPTTAGAPAGGGTLQQNATYRYRASWYDVYTGEESELGAELEQAMGANGTVNLTINGAVPYPGAYYYNDAAGAAGDDVGVVIYRTDPNAETFYFLTTLDPGTLAYADTGDALDKSIKGIVRDYQDMPRMNFATEFRSMLFGVSWDLNVARVYHNEFRKEKSFWSRWDPRGFRELPLQDGEMLTGVQNAKDVLVCFSNTSAYELFANPTGGRISMNLNPLEWTVGSVGPKASNYKGGWVYFLSERGPYRWKRGLSEPDPIGKNLLPLFIDPESGLCQLNEALRDQSEVLYDRDTDTVRFIFACGPSATNLNRHLAYWVQAERFNGDPHSGWTYKSPQAQALDYTHVYEGLVGGLPVEPADKRGRLIWSDGDGFLYECDPVLTRGGLPQGQPATGTALAGSGVNLIVTAGGLYVNGDDMEGLRLEVVHTDGTIDVTTVASNTATNIVPTDAFSQDPTGGTWYVAGIPAYWRSWVDHAGQPAAHKDITHFYVGFNLEDPSGVAVLDLQFVVANDWPVTASRTITTTLDKHRDKVLVARTGRFLTYETANSRPDEKMLITYIDPDIMILDGRRKG
jgi:hypothetical protein